MVKVPVVPSPKRDPYYTATETFVLGGEEQFVEVADSRQTVRRCRKTPKTVLEETVCKIASNGCYIKEIRASPSGAWLVTQRISGQGEWGYDVFRTAPLSREAGVTTERGYILDLPAFAPDESFLVGAAGEKFLGGWWADPDQDPDEPPRPGPKSLGFLFVHRLPKHRVTRHELRVKVPKGWAPEDPWAEWYGPRKITVRGDRVRMMPSWGVPFEIKLPLPRVIVLPTPHPAGKGLL
jgi:hypothetical protein